MARVPYLDRDGLRPEDRDIFDGLQARRGEVINLFRALAHAPDALRLLVPYSTRVRYELSLPPELRELAILTVGRICGAEYESTHHWNEARRIGVPREKLEALGDYEHAPVFSAEERAVIRYAAEATRSVRVGDATFEALRFLGTRQIVELVQVVAYYNMIVRILEPLQIDLEPGRTRAP